MNRFAKLLCDATLAYVDVESIVIVGGFTGNLIATAYIRSRTRTHACMHTHTHTHTHTYTHTHPLHITSFYHFTPHTCTYARIIYLVWRYPEWSVLERKRKELCCVRFETVNLQTNEAQTGKKMLR